MEIFLKNGYPKKVIHRILYEEKREEKAPKEFDPNRIFYIPFHPRGRRLCKVLEEKFEMKTVHQKTKTLGDILKKKGRKPEIIHKKHVVYQIPCTQCDISYVGQTKKTVKQRMGEHERKCRQKTNIQLLTAEKQENGLAMHHVETGHEFAFQNIKILAEEKGLWRRLIREGIEIRRNKNLANLKRGYEISEIWDPFLNIPP